jgi:ribose transport system substrate-binding protein
MKQASHLAILSAALIAAGLAFGSAGPAAAQDGFKIGVSNTVQGNGWREEMICAIKAQALASGKVASLNIAHRNTDAAGQLEDIRNLISAGVDAIVVNPADPSGINPALKEATDAGIVVVAVDQAVTEPSAYVISNNQEEYAYLGAKWLFEQLGGKGDVIYMRGAAGAPADSDRDKGFKRALAEFPDIKVVHEVFTGWQQDQGKQQILDFIATGAPFDGIWTSGIDNVIVDALVESDVDLVPVVGADNAGFVGQLNSVEGLKGAAVTNPGSIGGAGITLAVQLLEGQKPASQTVLVEPELWENVTEEGKAKLAAAADPSLDPEWPVSISIPGWTTYSKDQIIACKGPGE